MGSPKGWKIAAKGAKRDQNGAKCCPKASKMEPKGAQGIQNGAKGKKRGQMTTKICQKFDFQEARENDDKNCKPGRVFWGHFWSKK